MGIAIRKAVAADATAACALLRRSIEECCAREHHGQPALLGNWLANKTPQNVAAWFATPSNYALIAERDGELLGLALLTQAGKLALCYVQPDSLRSGIGQALLAGIEDQARAWCISKLHLQSPVSASAFFEHHGYSNAGKEITCFGLECDLLWKRLDAVDSTGAGAAHMRFCNCSSQ